MPFYDSAYLQTLKDLHSIADVSEKIGLQLHRGRRIFCPKCQPEGGRTPDLTLYGSSLHCFKCAWHPDIFELIQECLGMNFPAAVAWLSDATPADSAKIRKLTAVSAEKEIKDYSWLFRQAQAMAHQYEEEVDSYLQSRGFSFAQLKRYIGYLPAERWVGRRSSEGRVVFPHYAYADAKLIPNLYGRSVVDDPDELRHDHGRGTRGFWAPNPQRARTSGHLVLTEGVFDALGLMAMGSPLPVVAIFGVQGFRFEKFPMLQQLTLALDKDQAGEKKATDLEELAQSRGIKVQRIPEEVYDGHKDLGAAWRAQSAFR